MSPTLLTRSSAGSQAGQSSFDTYPALLPNWTGGRLRDYLLWNDYAVDSRMLAVRSSQSRRTNLCPQSGPIPPVYLRLAPGSAAADNLGSRRRCRIAGWAIRQ